MEYKFIISGCIISCFFLYISLADQREREREIKRGNNNGYFLFYFIFSAYLPSKLGSSHSQEDKRWWLNKKKTN